MSSNCKYSSKQLHLAMFPWFAFGHFIPYLHLSNKLAEKGHRVTFLLPKGAQPKLEQLNHYPNLIQFFPLHVPSVNGIPSGAETASDVPQHLHGLLAIAFDQVQDQVEAILRSIKPDMVVYDMAHWVPALAHKLSIKAIYYSVVSAAANSGITRRITKGMSVEELIQLPPAYPSSKVRLKADEAPLVAVIAESFGIGLSFQDRVLTSIKGCDVQVYRTYPEIEGPFCEYISQHFGKPVLLTGPCLPETETNPTQLEGKWDDWLSQFEPSSVVFYAFGSQITFEREEFEELVLGFELSGQPFLVALTPPEGFASIEEALPEGFEEGVKGRGVVHGGWVPQELILNHPSVGCFVNHCGYGTMWESLLSDCQIVLIPRIGDQIFNTRLLVEELKVAVEVERGENRLVSKEKLSKAIKLVMDKDNEVASVLETNHANLKKVVSSKELQEEYINNFIQGLQDLLK